MCFGTIPDCPNLFSLRLDDDVWQMPQISVANATDVAGKCHGCRWQMPRMLWRAVD